MFRWAFQTLFRQAPRNNKVLQQLAMVRELKSSRVRFIAAVIKARSPTSQALATKESAENLGTRLRHLARLGAIKTALTVSRKLGGEEARLSRSIQALRSTSSSNWEEAEIRTRQSNPGLWLLQHNLRMRVGDTEGPSPTGSRELKRWGSNRRSSSHWGAAAAAARSSVDGVVTGGPSVVKTAFNGEPAAVISLRQQAQRLSLDNRWGHLSNSRSSTRFSKDGHHAAAGGAGAARQPSAAVMWSRAKYSGHGGGGGGGTMHRVPSLKAPPVNAESFLQQISPSNPIRSAGESRAFFSAQLPKLKPDNEAMAAAEDNYLQVGTATSGDLSSEGDVMVLPGSPAIQNASSMLPHQKVSDIALLSAVIRYSSSCLYSPIT